MAWTAVFNTTRPVATPHITSSVVWCAETQLARPVVVNAFTRTLVKTGSLGSRSSSGSSAASVALLWGKTTGNTINAFRDGPRSPFGALVTLFYGPLFAVIGALNAALAKLPPIPAAASAALGAVLWVPQALHIAALGALCVPLKLALRL